MADLARVKAGPQARWLQQRLSCVEEAHCKSTNGAARNIRYTPLIKLPWMMAGRWDGDKNCDNLTFYSLSTEKTIKIHVPVIKGKRVVASGSSCVVAIDKDDDLSAMLVNPLMFFHNNGSSGWITDEGRDMNNLKEKVTCYMGKLAAMHGEQMRTQLIELDDDNVDAFEWFMNKVELLGTCQSMSDRRWGLPGDNRSNDRFIAPVFAKYAKKYPGSFFLKVYVDELKLLKSTLSMPTFLFIKDGAEADKVVGSRKDDLQITIEKHVRSAPASASAKE
ncbi:hypothetical protein E2562_021827 [Oryza meyeriana var. granulata]|uniref:Thioredoxin domain-containing protein n=1 Tax=Oryza meyeriana var. granulata TaxID=110450 RepID=A0A6G1ENA7_9ORYZ|nr:hypothetical protein E2562_021827 [Oryza meyeriana var. granulata]